MKTRTLGRNGPTVSAIGLGCMGMSFAYGGGDQAESLATLEHAPIVDVTNHHALVDAMSWRDVTRGHIGNVRRDGKFIVADLFVNDLDTVDAIEDGERVEIIVE